VQPPARRSRRIVRDLRPDGPLVYQRLSTPSLFDAQKTETSWRSRRSVSVTRREWSGSRCTCSATRGRARRGPGVAREARAAGRPVQGQSQFSTWLHRLVVNTCKDVAQAAGQRSGGRSRSSRTRVSRRTAIRPARSPSRRRASSSAAALPSSRRTGDRRCAEGRLRRAVRGDLAFDGPARRHGQVLRAPRSKRSPGAVVSMSETVLMDKAAIERILPHRDRCC